MALHTPHDVGQHQSHERTILIRDYDDDDSTHGQLWGIHHHGKLSVYCCILMVNGYGQTSLTTDGLRRSLVSRRTQNGEIQI